MQELLVVKIGGNIVDDEQRLGAFLEGFALLPQPRILVHGGGKLATELAERLQLPQTMVDGRRITDRDTLKVVTMVYAGLINKTIVAGLQRHACAAIGLSGADGNTIRAHKRLAGNIDYGYAGDIDEVNGRFLAHQLQGGYIPVIAPITHDGKGQLLNTNADTIAQEIAKAMSSLFDTTLVYCFEKPGVLLDVDREDSVVRVLDRSHYQRLREEGRIFAGMIPKLDNAFSALDAGVGRVIIGQAEQLPELTTGASGTTIINKKNS